MEFESCRAYSEKRFPISKTFLDGLDAECSEFCVAKGFYEGKCHSGKCKCKTVIERRLNKTLEESKKSSKISQREPTKLNLQKDS